MEDIAVTCSWADDELIKNASLVSLLPLELITLIQSVTGSRYLDAITSATLIPQCTDQLLVLYKPLISEIAARWLSRASTHSLAENVTILSSLSRILPFAPYLRPHLRQLLAGNYGYSRLENAKSSLVDLSDDQLLTFLLAFFRLFNYDADTYGNFLHPALLTPLLRHSSLPVRYLSIQCLVSLMKFADAFSEKLISNYIGFSSIKGMWEGKEIDYRLVKLFEELRWNELASSLRERDIQNQLTTSSANSKVVISDLSFLTADIGGVLVPRFGREITTPSKFVRTSSSLTNMHSLGKALLNLKPILMIGPADSGKTSMILEAARALGKLSNMITLQLNDQTDAKSLLGIHTTSASAESFVWQPGVLTRAMQEGRWVLIEDFDRAPSEVLGLLRPILERGEIYIPNRKEHVKASEGFRILATVRCSDSGLKSGSNHLSFHLSPRLWSIVSVTEMTSSEIEATVRTRFPALHHLMDTIFSVHRLVIREFGGNSDLRYSQTRLPSIRDLVKWCRRTNARLTSTKSEVNGVAIPDSAKVNMLKDAVDCYAGNLQQENQRILVAGLIASEMQISPQQLDHTLKRQRPDVSKSKTEVKIGRSSIPTLDSHKFRGNSTATGPFALTRHARRTMESIASGICSGEPILLVGETGVGKTTLVQNIASLVGQKLTVVNLSQQSEASDLLGGLKPVNTQTLVVPIIDEFASLFDDTFSNKRNEKFQTAVRKAISRQNWPRLLLLWQEALQMAENSLQEIQNGTEEGLSVHHNKRRKLLKSRHSNLRQRWTSFSINLEQLRVHLERGESNPTFTFVEGRLVKAVRNGEWLLLDEINLASSDTLDQIISLLQDEDDGRPFLTLTETGNVENIFAHPNFRVLAAMNPANDTGKKDLAPGLRSRFTEIYVPPGDTDRDDLIELIDTYLGPLLSVDNFIAADLATTYLKVRRMNEERRLTDGAGEIPPFSLRSLVRCLQFVVLHNADFGLRRSVVEGFAMSFFTMLSRESENLVFPILTGQILSRVKNPRSLLAQAVKSKAERDYVTFKHHRITKGGRPITQESQYIITPSVERNLLNLARAASMQRFPILLQGPTSSGKTSMIEHLAKISGNKFVRINNHEHTDLQEYLGSYTSGVDGKLMYQDGVLVDALRQGHWIVLDELNLAPSDVLEALNRLLDDNRELLIPETQEVVHPHPGFMLFATQNPAGLYGGRKRLSRAFRNRFLELHFDDIPEGELEVILRERSQIAPSFCSQIVAVYKKLSLQRQSSRLFEQRNSFATLRDLFRWASRPIENRTQLAQHGFMLLGERVRDPTERLIVKKTIEEVIRIDIDEKELYGTQTLPVSFATSKTVIWTPAMRRLFVLVSKALSNNEPVLLVGETGCGKTQVCETIAQTLQKQLHTYNAHTNTETGDLIGSQRPIRNRSELAKGLREDFVLLKLPAGNEVNLNEREIDDLIQDFQGMNTESFERELVSRIRDRIAAFQSLFQWSDGSLIRAMRNGDYFLLDEISLAEDSVLERLNSVLEPSRTILLAEKGVNDNVVVGAPGFQFLSTMNPGGDYGKRELSAALRNRLTEIWVPPLSEGNDVLPILEAKLGQIVAPLAPKMLDFAHWFRDQFHQSRSNPVPLRSLLAWTDFINKSNQLNVEAAFVHGAALVFIDTLGANPAAIIASSISSVYDGRRLCFNKLNDLLNNNGVAIEIFTHIPTLFLDSSHLNIAHFSLQRTSSGQTQSEMVFEAPTTISNTLRLVRALQVQRPILLEGSPGVGKTAIVTSLANLLGKEFTRINLSDQTDVMDLFGADVPSEGGNVGYFSWRDGPMLQAMQSGGWILLDEMNLASQSVLEGLNACLDHRQEVFVAELNRTFRCHPNFKLFAAQNPHHEGGGRKGLPASFVNRFTVVYADPLQKEDLDIISRMRFPDVEDGKIGTIMDALDEVQHAFENNPSVSVVGGPWDFNLRDVSRWCELARKYQTIGPSNYFDTLITQRFRTTAQRSIGNKVLSKLSGDIEPSLFHNLGTDSYQVGSAFLKREQILQHVSSHQPPIPTILLKHAKSMIVGINQGWPIILSGHSASGKTVLIRSLAALSGAHLIELSLSANTDTMDLLGGFEQYDPLQKSFNLKKELSQHCRTCISVLIVEKSSPEMLNAVMELYQQCERTDTEFEPLQTHLNILSAHDKSFLSYLERLKALYDDVAGSKLRFTWNDGALVDAVRNGSWLVLDNANLCNPSVLDRLNSLLEPNGSLVITEQHSADSTAQVIERHPDFRIFLTIDPRYGELTRAMRNRALEIHIDLDGNHLSVNEGLQHTCSSYIARLRQVNAVVSNGKISLQELTRYAVNYLSGFEIQSTDAELIINLNSELSDIFSSQLELRRMLPSSILAKSRQLVTNNFQDSVCTLGFTNVQPSVQMLNEPLTMLVGSKLFTEAVRSIAQLHNAWVDVCGIKIDLRKAVESNTPSNRLNLSLLQRSMADTRRSGSRSIAEVPPFFKFLLGFCNSLEAFLMGKIQKDIVASVQALKIFEAVAFAKDMLLLSRGKSLEPGIFQAYLQCAKGLVETIQPCGSLQALLQESLKVFQDDFELKAGQSLDRMWKQWKPWTPSTNQQLEDLLSLEGLTKRFDDLSNRVRAPRKEIAKIRSDLVQTSTLVIHNNDQLKLFKTDFEKILTSLELESQNTTCLPGHFSIVFTYLHWTTMPQLNGGSRSDDAHNIMSYFAGSIGEDVTSFSTSSFVSETLKRISRISSSESDQNFSNLFDPQTSGILLRQLSTCGEQRLGGLDYALEEIDYLAKALSTKSRQIEAGLLSGLRSDISALFVQVWSCHKDLLTETARESLDNHNSIAVSHSLLQLWRTQELFADHVPKDHYFVEIASDWLIFGAQLAVKEPADKVSDTGAMIFSFCMASLRLLVPDRPFDPAIFPAITRERYARRVTELKTRLEALRFFQLHTTGQSSNHYIEMIETELAGLGDEPAALVVVRPATSELNHLREEFTNLLRFIVRAESEHILLSTFEGPWSNLNVKSTQRIEEARRLGEHIDGLAGRLRKVHRAYDDICKPILWTLNTLRLGVKLLATSFETEFEVRNQMESLKSHIPMCGGDPISISSWQLVSVDQKQGNPDLRLFWLRHLRLQEEISKPRNHSMHGTTGGNFLKIVDAFYTEWKSQLSKDQAVNAAKSRYYSYRSQDEDDDAAMELERKEMFPTYDEVAEDSHEFSKDNYDSRETTTEIADLHDKIWSPSSVQQGIHEYVLQSLQDSGSAKSKGTHLSCHGTFFSHLPAILLLLQERHDNFHRAVPLHNINIYTDGDVVESSKLQQLVYSLEKRFTEIRKAWPEHAVPGDVLNCCREILQFKLNDPIAKLLTKTEKLFEIIGQWESVSSREFSALQLQDQVSKLIIHWRQLELSSWSQLLDLEKDKHERDAKLWYFILYEAVLVNTRYVLDNNGDLATYQRELAQTLQEFLAASSRGQFNFRLRMLAGFQAILASMFKADERLTPVEDCVSSILSYFQRYESPIQNLNEKERLGLEKAVLEQIKLASWKDTHPTSLRDSARRSHHKLFKIVRKYRNLLGQPVTFSKSSTTQNMKVANIEVSPLRAAGSSQALVTAIEYCQNSLSQWQHRSERYVNPLGAASTMQRVYSAQLLAFLPQVELAAYRENLVSSITELRSQTPKTATKDNEGFVRHLKERKRRLLADTLKFAATSGIRRSLPTKELEAQSSTAKILAASPSLRFNLSNDIATSANETFCELLDSMPIIRQFLSDHSEDLTDSEVRRSVGFMEGILSILVKQRIVMSTLASEIDQLRQTVQSLSALEQCSLNDIRFTTSSMRQLHESYTNRLPWVQQILKLSCRILAIQATHSDTSNESVIHSLEIYQQKIETLDTRLSEEFHIPEGLCNNRDLDIIEDIQRTLEELRADIKRFSVALPETNFVLIQLIPWTYIETCDKDSEAPGSDRISFEEFDNAIRNSIDKVFVAIQKVVSVSSESIQSTDETGWLVRCDARFKAINKALHTSKLVESIKDLLLSVSNMNGEQAPVVASSLVVARPILEQYYHICCDSVEYSLLFHHELCRFANSLAKSFTSLGSEGFCSPSEPSQGEEKEGQVEAGTGLGEGEGADDISKDVGDDEDLTELAQAEKEESKDDQLENSRDAVDMGLDDLNGDFQDFEEVDDEKDEEDNDDGRSEDDAEGEIDEETGSVDDLDPSAVDEKMWDEGKEEQGKELESSKGKGTKSDDQNAAEVGDTESMDNPDSGSDDDLSNEEESIGNDENADARPDAEQMDVQAQEDNILELPEELQLNGEENADKDQSSDDAMGELSDTEIDEEGDVSQTKPNDDVPGGLDMDESEDEQGNSDVDEDDNAMGKDEMMEEQPESPHDLDQDQPRTQDDNMQFEYDERQKGETGASGGPQEDEEKETQQQSKTSDMNQPVGQSNNQMNDAEDVQAPDDGNGAQEQGQGNKDSSQQPSEQNETLKQLAEVLDKWHRRRDILPAIQPTKQDKSEDKNIEMKDAEFEHIQDDEEAEAQALGTSGKDNSQNLDQGEAIEDENMDLDPENPVPNDLEDEAEDEESIEEQLSRLQTDPKFPADAPSGAFVPDHDQGQNQNSRLQNGTSPDELSDGDDEQQTKYKTDPNEPILLSTHEASRYWSHYSATTQQFSLVLTEQLRLILAPTLATKLRGDFRTGKRLNIKRIIPYIASQYKRDKIWMRRSVPSKRNYQIMLAVDDSKSMREGGAWQLAFETVAMLCKSLSMLEVGELCVVGFGNEEHIRIAHTFDQPFSGEAGVRIFQNFTFNQLATDVRKLVTESIRLFQTARARATQSQSDLWQLELIISDGICQDHEDIQRLVRQAAEEKIMIVFVIVDSVNGSSIMDLTEVSFEPDSSAEGEMKMSMRRYLEKFPFPYYLVVRDVRDLPAVLAIALKGWFAQVVDVQ